MIMNVMDCLEIFSCYIGSFLVMKGMIIVISLIGCVYIEVVYGYDCFILFYILFIVWLLFYM